MLLTLEQVTKTFTEPGGSGSLRVLDEISLTLEEGESLAITGPSGSGKSTFLNLIAALDQPDTGTILFRGQNPHQFDEAEAADYRNREIGMVFQQHHLLPQCTALENVLIPKLANGEATREDIEQARELLEAVGMTDRADHRPAELSGGQRQRVALARALVNRPALLLADEPTGSLDQTHAKALVQLLQELNLKTGCALIVVTHDTSIAAKMKRHYQLTNGKLVPHGRSA